MEQATSGERATRDASWGGARARALLHAVSADAAARAGFKVAALEVVRPQGLLEFVAITGEPDGADALLGTGSRLEDMVAAIADGETYGAFTFVAEEAYSPGVEERLRDASWIRTSRRRTTPPTGTRSTCWWPRCATTAEACGPCSTSTSRSG